MTVDHAALKQVQKAAVALVVAIRALWANPHFVATTTTSWDGKRVETKGNEGARRLPESGQYVRGTPHVDVATTGDNITYEKPSTARNLVLETLSAARAWPVGARGGEVTDDERAIHEALARLNGALIETPSIVVKLSDAMGWKTYSHSELIRQFEGNPEKEVNTLALLWFPVADSLHNAGVNRRGDGDDAAWQRAGDEFAALLAEIATRNEHHYEAVAYLNAPLVDSTSPIVIGTSNGIGQTIAIRAATDDDLTRALKEENWGPLPLGLSRANTVLTFPVTIRVDASVDEYESVFPAAETTVGLIVDVLRLVCDGDIGVAALRVFATSRETPRLRRTYSWNYEPGNSPFIPRRLAFTWPSEQLLSAEQIQDINDLIPKRFAAEEWPGLRVAFQRFRDSCERFHPEEPAKLLDIAIAFEALLLSDGGDKELSYRLRLRGSRWLEQDLPSRKRTFDLLKLLYTLRSTIAHGENLDTGNERVALVLREAPVLLRRTLRKSLDDDNAPARLSKDAASARWKEIELG